MVSNNLSFSLDSYLYGQQVEFNDLVKNPLSQEEVLMQDKYHHFYRLKIPNTHSSVLDKMVYWVQTHLNTTEHLDAISNLLNVFESKVLTQSFSSAEELEEVNTQAETLCSFIPVSTSEKNTLCQKLDKIKEQAFERRESVVFYQFNMALLTN